MCQHTVAIDRRCNCRRVLYHICQAHIDHTRRQIDNEPCPAIDNFEVYDGGSCGGYRFEGRARYEFDDGTRRPDILDIVYPCFNETTFTWEFAENASLWERYLAALEELREAERRITGTQFSLDTLAATVV